MDHSNHDARQYTTGEKLFFIEYKSEVIMTKMLTQ